MAIEVLPDAVLRVAAWPVEMLDGFADDPGSQRLAAAEDEYRRVADAVSDRIHDAVPGHDRLARRWLLGARRAVHAGVSITVAAPASVARPLVAEIEALEQPDLAGFEAAWRVALDRDRAVLGDLVSKDQFRVALALAEPGLFKQAERARARWLRPGRALRLDRALMRRLLRGVGRAVAHAGWAGYAPIASAHDTGGRLTVRTGSASRRVDPDLAAFAEVLRVWASGPEIPLRATGATHRRADGWWVADRRIGDSSLLDGLLGTWSESVVAPSALASTVGGEVGHRIPDLAAGLRRAGALEAVIGLDLDASSSWEALEGAAVPAHRQSDWDTTVSSVRAAADRMAGTDDPQVICAAHAAANSALTQLGNTAVHNPVLLATTTVPFRGSWDDKARLRFASFVAERLAVLAPDAERHRLNARPAPGPAHQGVLAPTTAAKPDARPGPVGTAVVVDGPEPWFRWGRPQPGLITRRATGLAPDIGDLKVVEVRGDDPENPTAMIGPPIGPVLRAGELRGLTILEGDPPLVPGPDGTGHLPVYVGGSVIGRRDPGSRILRTLAMAHGWELAGWGDPHDGRTRWVIESADVDAIHGSVGAARYRRWRKVAVARNLPPLVLARLGVRPDRPETIFPTSSPLAVDSLFDRWAADTLVLTELPPVHEWVVTAGGHHHWSELALDWIDRTWRPG